MHPLLAQDCCNRNWIINCNWSIYWNGKVLTTITMCTFIRCILSTCLYTQEAQLTYGIGKGKDTLVTALLTLLIISIISKYQKWILIGMS